ncbi:hypothetical protein NLI96_g7437 [Meripilus lineatus]|uniref:Transmembrane protein n=1 Tax=Meripilus lineatus TaxID=2056292 RepID=A0AAD5V3Y5_9APHY|nr:hypothetical protein NLI96_g7437 [Physisporinus lineatus]
MNRGTYSATTPHTTIFEVQPPVLPPQGNVGSYQVQSRGVRVTISNWGSSLKSGYESVKVTIENNSGMLFVAASQAFFSLMNVAVKKLNSIDTPVPAFELILVRMGITWICCVSYMFSTKVPDPFLGPKGVRLLLVVRGFVGPNVHLSNRGIVSQGDVFVQRSSRGSLVGVVLIARPEFLFGHAAHVTPSVADIADNAAISHVAVTPAQRLGAVGVALLGVCGATGAYTTIRAIGKRAHPLHNLVSFSSQCVIVATIALLVTGTPIVVPTRIDWGLMLIMIGIFGFIAQVLLTMGLQRETAGRGTMAVYVQECSHHSTLFERIFFHTVPSPLSIVGTIIIITSAIYVAVTKEPTPQKCPATLDDISLEEGLLANEDDVDHNTNPPHMTKAEEKEASL